MTNQQLTQEERYLISSAPHGGCHSPGGDRAYLRSKRRAPISRELQRNATTHDQRYRPSKAHLVSWMRQRSAAAGAGRGSASRCIAESRRTEAPLRADQIVGCIRAQGLAVPRSKKRSNRRLRHDKRRGGTLYRYLKDHVQRRRANAIAADPTRGVLLGKPHISERPAAVEQPPAAGPWEGDHRHGAREASPLPWSRWSSGSSGTLIAPRRWPRAPRS